jgi:hypothetical protein
VQVVFNRLFIYVLIPLSRWEEGGDPINRLNPATDVCLSQVKTWISTSCGVVFCMNFSNILLRALVLVCVCNFHFKSPMQKSDFGISNDIPQDLQKVLYIIMKSVVDHVLR